MEAFGGMTAQIIAILRAIEERVTAIEALLGTMDDPDSVIRLAMHDILRIYGLVAQISEVATQQRDQIQALSEALVMVYGRQLEYNRTAVTQGIILQIELEKLVRQGIERKNV